MFFVFVGILEGGLDKSVLYYKLYYYSWVVVFGVSANWASGMEEGMGDMGREEKRRLVVGLKDQLLYIVQELLLYIVQEF